MHRRFLALASFLLCAAAWARAQLESRGTSPVALYPTSVVSGDFNKDGKPDLAIAAMGSSTSQLTVLLNNGNGTFRVGGNYAVGGGDLWSVASADFNHDSNLDLAVVQYLNNIVSVLFGNGDGTFQPEVDYALPEGPIFVATGDFNGDKIPDIIALDHYYVCQCLSVLLNNGDGTFGSPIDTPIPFPYGQAIALGDFNGDGKLDVAVAGEYGAESSLQIFLGNGDGTFTAGTAYNLGNYPPQSFAVADLRNNGILDLVMPGGAAGSFAVFLGNGDGTFQPMVVYLTGIPQAVAVADFNVDGKPDIIVGNNDSEQHISGVTVFLGRGNGTFKKGYFYSVGNQPVAIAVADFNGDKKPDVAIADGLNSYVTAMLNTGIVSFSPATPLNFGAQPVGTTSSPQTVKLTNKGKSAVTISSMKTTGQFGMTSTCGSSVPAGANCSISVTFSPKSNGAKSGTVTINDSASSKPQVIELSGTGN